MTPRAGGSSRTTLCGRMTGASLLLTLLRSSSMTSSSRKAHWPLWEHNTSDNGLLTRLNSSSMTSSGRSLISSMFSNPITSLPSLARSLAYLHNKQDETRGHSAQPAARLLPWCGQLCALSNCGAGSSICAVVVQQSCQRGPPGRDVDDLAGLQADSLGNHRTPACTTAARTHAVRPRQHYPHRTACRWPTLIKRLLHDLVVGAGWARACISVAERAGGS